MNNIGKYGIFYKGNLVDIIGGAEAAWDTWKTAIRHFTDCDLVWMETGEVIASTYDM